MQVNFWSEWPSPLRSVFLFFGALLVASILYSLYADQRGIENIVHWQVVGQKTVLDLPVHSVPLGSLDLTIPAVNNVLFETFAGGPVVPNQVASYFFSLILMGILVLSITSITYLPRIWNAVSTVIYIVALWYCQFWQLKVFGLDDHTFFILVAVLYLATAYYFRNVRRELDYITRLKVFTALTAGIGLLIYFFAEIPSPFLLLSANGFLVFFLVGLVFVMMISHEILHFILIAITRQGISSGSNLIRFNLFSLIYLINVTLMLLHDTHVIDWNFYYLNPYVLLAVSSVLGLWGLQTRKELFKSIQEFPILVYMYLVMALSCFGSLLYFLGNANDPILQVFKDTIIYSHFGFGAIFYLYIIINFMGLLRKNVPFEKVIYKPRNMPHFTFRFAGFMVVLGFALKENIEVPLFQTISGTYNNIGDYYLSANDLESAILAYEEGKIYGFKNHKSNYALGKIYETTDVPKAVEHFNNAVQVRPTEMAYANLSTLWSKTGDLYNSLFILSDAQKEFPRGSKILNNKGFLFYTMNLPDSALIYFDAASRAGASMDVPITNYLGLAAKYQLPFDSDSIVHHYEALEKFAILTNALALDNAIQAENQWELPPMDSVWNLYSASLLSNYLINEYHTVDSSVYFRQERYARHPENIRYGNEVRFQTALGLYFKGHVNRAIEILENLSVIASDNQAKYLFTLGVIRSEQMDYTTAGEHFDYAVAQKYPKARLASSVCDYMIGKQDSAKLEWNEMARVHADSISAKRLLQLVSTPPLDLAEQERVQWVRMHPLAPITVVDDIVSSISDPGIRNDLLLHLVARLQRTDNLTQADTYLSQISGMESDRYQRLYLLINASMNGSFEIPETDFDDINLLRNNGNPYDQRDSIRYQSLARINAYNIPSVVEAVHYYRMYGQSLDAYNVLLDALRVNARSIPLLKMYIEECLNESLASYALNGLKSLHQLVDTDTYNLFILEHADQLSEVFGNDAEEINP